MSVTADRIEALRRAAEALEHAAGTPTERDLVRTLVERLPHCSCCAPALWRSVRGGHSCDACAGPGAVLSRGLAELPHAPALRALLARMTMWTPAEQVAANDGGAT